MKLFLLNLFQTIKQDVLSAFAFLSRLATARRGRGNTVGQTGKVWTEVAAETTDVEGSKTRFAGLRRHASVVFNDGSGEAMWNIGGESKDGDSSQVWKSTDGKAWKKMTSDADFPARFGHAAVVFDGAMWVIGGEDPDRSRLNDVWKSTNGRDWTEVTSDAGFLGRHQHTVTVYKHAMWVIGGFSHIGGRNDVWRSTDGKTWTETVAHTNAANHFTPRWAHNCVVFKNELWILGGHAGIFKNDVWRSKNGISWTKVKSVAPFPLRRQQDALVFDDAMWVIGGWSEAFKSDVWRSTDGSTWTEETSEAGFTGRAAHKCLVFDGSMWVIGGTGKGYKNDVWRYP